MSVDLDLLAPEVRADPHPFFAALRRKAGLCRMDPGGLFAVTRYEDVIYVLKNPQLFSSAIMSNNAQTQWLPVRLHAAA